MTISADAAAVLARVDALGIQPAAGARGWTHMGAVLADAALQPRMTYKTVVLPRVRRLIAAWPDADTTSALSARVQHEDTAAVLDWSPTGKKVRTFLDLVQFLTLERVETTSELQASLRDPEFRGRLVTVKGVGPKTIDYLSILTGSTEHVAVDSQLRAFLAQAGAAASSYEDVQQVVTHAAKARGWPAGALDAAIWAYQSGSLQSGRRAEPDHFNVT